MPVYLEGHDPEISLRSNTIEFDIVILLCQNIESGYSLLHLTTLADEWRLDTAAGEHAGTRVCRLFELLVAKQSN
jgi:hypothetical protein